MVTTAEQRAQTCPECAANPKAAPGPVEALRGQAADLGLFDLLGGELA